MSNDERLVVSILRGDEDRVQKLLAMGASPNAQIRQEDGSPVLTALMAAAMADQTGLATLLLEKGADPNMKGQMGQTALIAAAAASLETTRLLIGKGADINAKTTEGETPLMAAIVGGSASAAELLIERGADVNATMSDGTSVLKLAKGTKAPKEILKLLKQHGAKG